jgi:DEAD/DEAH box helicase domain-containing protein
MRGEELLRRVLPGSAALGTKRSPVTHVERVAARGGHAGPWPDWVTPLLVERLRLRGITSPWRHQAEAASLAHAGQSVVIATGTASGKSLGYQLPVLTALLAEPRDTALYLAPTKALAADQLRSVRDLALAQVRAASFDGDTPPDERDWVRAHSRWIFTNPDMLHRSILPAHARWSAFLRRLRYVVIDECHGYRGIFGSHVAHVIRRLRRICAKYGGSPTFILASATASAPAESASRLVGVPVRAVDVDASPRGALDFALWEPPLLEGVTGENGAPVRRSSGAEAARLLADLVVEGARTIAFVRSRRGAEIMALSAKRALAEAAPELVGQVAAYRAGYLAEERRALETALDDGSLRGVAATNALELGIDITGMDAVVLSGYPGTIASLWQQAGRAGREGQGSLAVFVARDDPLDTYLVHHPAAIFGRPVEATVLDPTNPHVLGPQLCCAAAELPLTEDDLPLFGADEARALLPDLVRRGLLRHRPAGWYWTSRQRPEVNIRGTGGAPVQVVEAATGRLLGTVDNWASHTSVHAGAVYLHQGASYVVDEFDVENGVAFVHAAAPDYTTSARDVTAIRIESTVRRHEFGPVVLHYGTVQVTNQVTGYLRKSLFTGELIEEVPLDLPVRTLDTAAVWYTLTAATLDAARLPWPAIPGAAHAAEHAAIGLLPLFATCDRWDIGGVSTALHEDTGQCTVFVYDGHPGGAGFAARGYDTAPAWLRATREAIAACECEAGCPSCVQSPKCGNGNKPLDKAGAIRLLDAVLAAIATTIGPHESG